MSKLYIFCGIPFSGKTTIARQIESRFGYKRIDLDEVKFELFGRGVKDSEIKQEGWDKVYQEMYKRIEVYLSKGETVIHDTGNFTRHERDLVRKIAEKLGIKAITVFIDTPKEVARDRLLQNRKTNDRFDVLDEDFESTVNEMEPPLDSERNIVYKSGQPLDQWIQVNYG